MHVVNDYQHSETTTILSLEKNKFGFRTKEVKEKIILIIGPNAYLGLLSMISLTKSYCSFSLHIHFHIKQVGNEDPALKPEFYIFLLLFQHK